MAIIIKNCLHPALLALLLYDDEILFFNTFNGTSKEYPYIGKKEFRRNKEFIKRTIEMELIAMVAMKPNAPLLKIIEKLQEKNIPENSEDKEVNIIFNVVNSNKETQCRK